MSAVARPDLVRRGPPRGGVGFRRLRRGAPPELLYASKTIQKLMLKSGAFYVLRRALCDVIFATGTMLDPLCGSSVLLLFVFLPFVNCVCPSCHGDAPGCTATDWASCLWNQGLATNVAAFAVVGATGVAKLGTLLPPKLLKMFNPRTVERLQMLSSRLSVEDQEEKENI